MKTFFAVRSTIVRILLAFATAVVVLGAILFAVALPRVALGQNGERPPSSTEGLNTPAPSGAAVSWTAATPYPTDIFGYAFAQDGENMYVISGGTSVVRLTLLYIWRFWS